MKRNARVCSFEFIMMRRVILGHVPRAGQAPGGGAVLLPLVRDIDDRQCLSRPISLILTYLLMVSFSS